MIQTVNVNVAAQPTSGGPESFLVLSQNENGRQIRFRILGDDLPAGCTATFSGTKPDGNVYSASGTIDGNFVLLDEEIQMTAVSGRWDAKLSIVKGTENIMTSLIRVTVVADAVSGDAIPSSSELDGIVAECRSYAEAAKNEAYGSPLTASTAAAMTDQSRVYVYTGSESGMTAGHWYYYNGTAWADGGVYNAVAVDTDTTLTIAGKAADAKKTGDEISAIEENLEGEITGILNELYITNSAQNLFDERSATKTLALSEGTFTSATSLYGFYVPIDASKGTITVRRKNIGTRFRIVSSIQEPSIGVNYFNREDHDTENGFTYTPLASTRYIYIAYYSSTQDTLTEAELLEDFAIYYGTGIQTEEISKIDLLAHAKDISFQNGAINASGDVVDSATNIISDKYRASGNYVVSCPSAYVVTVHVLDADGSVNASYETTNGVKRYNLTGIVRVTIKKADDSAITPSSVDFSQIKISGAHFSPLAYTNKMTFILDAENSKTSDVYAYIDSHMKTHGMYATKQFLCNDSSGMPIYYYTLGDGAKTIFLVSGQHGPAIVSGDPRDSVISVAKIMCDLMDGNFAVGSFLEKLHDEYTIVIIPVFNPYGFDNFSRTNGDGVDTNRDWTNGNVVQVAAAKQLINDVNPFMLLDIHCNGSNPVDLPNLEIQYNFGTYNDQFGNAIRKMFKSYYNTDVYGRPNTVDANMLGPYARVTLGILGGLLELRWWLKEDEILHNSQVESANYAMIINAIKFFATMDASEAYNVERTPNQNQY